MKIIIKLILVTEIPSSNPLIEDDSVELLIKISIDLISIIIMVSDLNIVWEIDAYERRKVVASNLICYMALQAKRFSLVSLFRWLRKAPEDYNNNMFMKLSVESYRVFL